MHQKDKEWVTEIRTVNKGNKYKTIINIVGINLITLNIKGLNATIKDRLLEGIKNKVQLNEV